MHRDPLRTDPFTAEISAVRFLHILTLAALFQGNLFAQGTLRLQPFGGQVVEIPVEDGLTRVPLTTQVYLVAAGNVYIGLPPSTTMRPDAFGVSRVEPVTVSLAGI